MACINMFNPDHPPMSPRISFSNDFVVDPTPPQPPRHPAAGPDFEFAVGNRPMMAADELFFKGRMLPLRGGETTSSSTASRFSRVTTLRDELIRVEDDENGIDGNYCEGGRPPKSVRWKEFLGLKKGNNAGAVSKKEMVTQAKSTPTQVKCCDGGGIAKDLEMGL